MSIVELYDLFLKSAGVCTDSRKALKGGIYFSIKGENFDGNEYANSALESGCEFAVVDDNKYVTSDSHILVPDALRALQELANYHRNKFDIPVVGITGSNGKTTTKELIYAVLTRKYSVIATKGNLNNHIGVPLTLLDINESHEIAIVEMGANHVNEIDFLCGIAEPNFGLVTNIGKAHIGEFGGWENIVKGKGELYDYLKSKSALVFVNNQDELLMRLTNGFRRFTYGDSTADISGEIVEAGDALKLSIAGLEIQSKLFGEYNFSNIMAAAAIGTYFKIEHPEIKKAIEDYMPSNNRSQVLKTKKNKLILDAYNANPTSMKAALDNFIKIANGNAYVILGDMLELGSDSEREHQEIIDSIIDNKLSGILVGKIFCEVNNSSIPSYENVNEVLSSGILKSRKNDTILLKGSRGIELEKLIDQL